jgi:hypothetical protein
MPHPVLKSNQVVQSLTLNWDRVDQLPWVESVSVCLNWPRCAVGACVFLLFVEVGLVSAPGDFTITADPHFLWITEFPLFTRADEDKDFLAKGRWSSSHHPFTAPMWQDIEVMYRGDIESVCVIQTFFIRVTY